MERNLMMLKDDKKESKLVELGKACFSDDVEEDLFYVLFGNTIYLATYSERNVILLLENTDSIGKYPIIRAYLKCKNDLHSITTKLCELEEKWITVDGPILREEFTFDKGEIGKCTFRLKGNKIEDFGAVRYNGETRRMRFYAIIDGHYYLATGTWADVIIIEEVLEPYERIPFTTGQLLNVAADTLLVSSK